MSVTVSDAVGNDSSSVNVTVNDVSSPPTDTAPTINSVTASPSTIDEDQTTSLSVNVTDDGLSALSYLWSAPSGSFDDATSATPVYTPASVDSTTVVAVSVTVSDAVGNDSSSTNVTVNDVDSGGGGPTTLLDESFNSGPLPVEWIYVEVGDKAGPSNWVVQNGRLEELSWIRSKPVNLTNVEAFGSHIYYAPGSSWTDYTFSHTLVSGKPRTIGSLVRYQDEANYIRFSWSPTFGYRRLVQRVSGVTTILAEDSVGYSTNTPYDIDIEVDGNEVTVSVDDVVIFGGPVVTSGPAFGTVGFYTFDNNQSYFDDALVTEQ